MWILARTKCRQEYRAEKNLNNQGFKCFLPTISIKRFIDNVWVEKKEVMFSGYLFINIAHLTHKLHKINNTYELEYKKLDKCTETGGTAICVDA